MAKISCSDLNTAIADRGYVSFLDPCLGGGVLLIAAANVASVKLKDKFNWQNHILFVGQDISYVAGLMGYVQLSLLGCAGYVKIGDSLVDPTTTTDDLSNYWFTPMYLQQCLEFTSNAVPG